MKCVMCKQFEPRIGFTTVTLQHGESNLVIKKVPSLICPECGEAYTDEKIAKILLDAAHSLEAEGLMAEEVFFQDILKG